MMMKKQFIIFYSLIFLFVLPSKFAIAQDTKEVESVKMILNYAIFNYCSCYYNIKRNEKFCLNDLYEEMDSFAFDFKVIHDKQAGIVKATTEFGIERVIYHSPKYNGCVYKRKNSLL
jgi:hypothetical protein